MAIAEGLRALLGADPAIAAIVGSMPASRIHPVVLPQASVFPALTYLEISAQRPHASPQGPLKLSGSRYQIDAWALSFTAARDLAEAVRKKLDGYRGAAGAETIQGVFLDNARDFYEADLKQYRASRDYMIWFEEPID